MRWCRIRQLIGYGDDQPATPEYLPNTHGDGLAGDLLEPLEPPLAELLLSTLLIEVHHDVGFVRLEVSRWIIERQVPVLADTDTGDVNRV
ncbi:MAG: hypothetical protein ACYTAS_19315 [Planctomycetota bacterium]|jgi:hypothetical protein